MLEAQATYHHDDRLVPAVGRLRLPLGEKLVLLLLAHYAELSPDCCCEASPAEVATELRLPVATAAKRLAALELRADLQRNLPLSGRFGRPDPWLTMTPPWLTMTPPWLTMTPSSNQGMESGCVHAARARAREAVASLSTLALRPRHRLRFAAPWLGRQITTIDSPAKRRSIRRES